MHPPSRPFRSAARRVGAACAIAAAMLAARGGSVEDAVRAVGPTSDGRGFTFHLATPALVTSSDGEGGYVVTLEGFATPEIRPGAPEIPTRIVRVAIPDGATPRLVLSSVRDSVRPGLRPSPVATSSSDLFEEGKAPSERPAHVVRHAARIPDPLFYAPGSRRTQPIAWLGETGVFRQQRYVEVHLAPVRFDPTLQGLRVATSLDVTVRFDGANAGAPSALDPRFESAYRDAFVNYAQGTTFRIEERAESAASGPAAPNAGPLYRIRVRANGVVRLDNARMSGTGFQTQPLSTWKLMNRGVEAPLEINDVNGNDLMDAGDWVQFYGQALDDEPKTVLNTDLPGTIPDLYEARDFTDENVYFLSVESGARSRVAPVPAAPTFTRTPPTEFDAIAHVETDSPDGFRPLGAADPWYWTPTMSASGGTLPTTRTIPVPLPGLSSGTAPARVLVKLRGTTEDAGTFPDHKSRITLKNAALAVLTTNDDDGTFDGRTLFTHDFTWTFPGSGAQLTSPAQVQIDARTVTGSPGYVNQFLLDWVEVRYKRTFQAASDVLTFDVPDADSEFIVSGLTSSAPEVWEITGRVGGTGVVATTRLTSPSITGAGPFTARFRVDNDPSVPDGTLRRFVVFGGGAVAVPANPDFTTDTVSDLALTTNQADMIVIAHPTVLGALSQTTLNQLLSYHASKGITSKIAMIQDVQDEFNNGLPGPLAIKNFLHFVMSTAPGEGWQNPKPSYVLLLGDGTYDYKGGTAQGNFVPTQILFRDDPSLGYYASDNVMAAVVGNDQLADLAVGRISARTDAEANTVLQKTLDYLQSPVAGTWRSNAILIADRGKRDPSDGSIDLGETTNFESVGDASESYMKRPPHTDQKFYYYTSYCTHVVPQSCNPAAIKGDIKNAVNFNGAAMVQFTGHGNADVWSDDAIWDDRSTNPSPDSNDLNNGGKLPWLLGHDCLTAAFHTTSPTSLGENWLKRSGGGSLAVFAPSDLALTVVGDTVANSLWNDVYGPRKEREIAVPVMNAISKLCGNGSTEPCQAYVLLGDPAATLAIPSVAPATNVVAVGGNARVDLSWTASTTAGAKYDVYRTTDPLGVPYTKLTATPVTGLTYPDTGLLNAQTYFYSIVAVDPSGYESRWSHFNSDCAVSGPDCLQATPLNPNPPAAPTGVVVTDPESGGKLNVSWAPNSENDLSSYEVRYGLAPGSHPSVVTTNKVTTSAVLSGLVDGTTYFIVVTATNTSGKTSSTSAEVQGTPTFVRGVKSPQFISDLRVAKSVNDAVLSWTAVTTTIYGKPATIARYEVYRGTTPTFVPGPGTLISPPTLTTPSFTDVGAIASASTYYYLVRAVDTQNNPGGLSNQLPMGIDTMTLTKSTITPGNIVLTWPAVTSEFTPSGTGGGPVVIDHYEIYARTTVFSRGDIRDGAVTLLTSTSALTIEITPQASTQYYSVIAVDRRGNKSPF